MPDWLRLYHRFPYPLCVEPANAKQFSLSEDN